MLECYTTQPNDGNNICCLYNTSLQEGKLTSQVLYNETQHHVLGKESGYFHFIGEEIGKKGETACSHLHSRPRIKLSVSPIHFFLSFLK
jgi:hypothetical protein